MLLWDCSVGGPYSQCYVQWSLHPALHILAYLLPRRSPGMRCALWSHWVQPSSWMLLT